MDSVILNLVKILLVFIILSVIGLNIFNYLAKAQNVLGEQAQKGISKGADVVQKTLDTSLQGTQDILDTTSQQIGKLDDIVRKRQPVEDDSNSVIQRRGKSGYCYIGEEDGVRTCTRVGSNEVCMSGDIYPTMDICINPNLRV